MLGEKQTHEKNGKKTWKGSTVGFKEEQLYNVSKTVSY